MTPVRVLTLIFLIGLEIAALCSGSPRVAEAPSPAAAVAATSTPLPATTVTVESSPMVASSPVAAPTHVASPHAATREVDFAGLTRQLERIRELKMLTPVPHGYKTAKEVHQYLLGELDHDAHWTEDTAFLVQFGFVKPGFNLRQCMLDFYTEQIAGFYDYHTKTFYMAPQAADNEKL